MWCFETDIAYGNGAYCYYVMRSNSQMRSDFNIKKNGHD